MLLIQLGVLSHYTSHFRNVYEIVNRFIREMKTEFKS